MVDGPENPLPLIDPAVLRVSMAKVRKLFEGMPLPQINRPYDDTLHTDEASEPLLSHDVIAEIRARAYPSVIRGDAVVVKVPKFFQLTGPVQPPRSFRKSVESHCEDCKHIWTAPVRGACPKCHSSNTQFIRDIVVGDPIA